MLSISCCHYYIIFGDISANGTENFRGDWWDDWKNDTNIKDIGLEDGLVNEGMKGIYTIVKRLKYHGEEHINTIKFIKGLIGSD